MGFSKGDVVKVIEPSHRLFGKRLIVHGSDMFSNNCAVRVLKKRGLEEDGRYYGVWVRKEHLKYDLPENLTLDKFA